MPTIPQDVDVVLAIIVAYISNRLQHDGLADWQNQTIAGSAFVVLTVLVMWLLGEFTGDWRNMATVFVGLTAYLGLHELSALLDYLKALPSPLARKPQFEPGDVTPTLTMPVVQTKKLSE